MIAFAILIISAVGGLAGVVVSAYLYTQDLFPGTSALSAMILGDSIWMSAGAGILLTDSVYWISVLNLVKWTGVSIASISFLLFAGAYTEKRITEKASNLQVMSVVGGITWIVIMVTRYRSNAFDSLSIATDLEYSYLPVEHSPILYACIAFLYLNLVIGTYWFLTTFRSNKRQSKKAVVMLVLGMIVVGIFTIPYSLEIGPYAGLDMSGVGLIAVVASTIYAASLDTSVRVQPINREDSFGEIGESVAVIDMDGYLTDYNKEMANNYPEVQQTKTVPFDELSLGIDIDKLTASNEHQEFEHTTPGGNQLLVTTQKVSEADLIPGKTVLLQNRNAEVVYTRLLQQKAGEEIEIPTEEINIKDLVDGIAVPFEEKSESEVFTQTTQADHTYTGDVLALRVLLEFLIRELSEQTEQNTTTVSSGHKYISIRNDAQSHLPQSITSLKRVLEGEQHPESTELKALKIAADTYGWEFENDSSYKSGTRVIVNGPEIGNIEG